ncbi:MAG: EutN/CcmL family microcompartment protein [Verrucomicrobiales bacterium]
MMIIRRFVITFKACSITELMRIGRVIGKVVMNTQDRAFKAARWVIISPVDAADLATACTTPPPLGKQPSIVAFDKLGVGEDDIVGFVEGAEATAPFDQPTPIDAITVALFDQIQYRPYRGKTA